MVPTWAHYKTRLSQKGAGINVAGLEIMDTKKLKLINKYKLFILCNQT